MIDDPQWIMVGLVVVGQVGASAWTIATLRGEVRAARDEAQAARGSAAEAHGRIDRLLAGARGG